MTTPLNKNHCPGGHEIYNFGRTFLALRTVEGVPRPNNSDPGQNLPECE